MVKILRNREVKRYFLAITLTGGGGIFLRFTGGDFASTFWPCAAIAIIVLLSYGFTLSRYRRLARLSQDLEKIAGGSYQMDIKIYTEGELSILASDLAKVTRILSHQAAALQKDKTYLANSIADISHQLKTPLTSLFMLCELLADPTLPPQKQQEFIDHIRTGIGRIQWLVSALLKLSRLDAGSVLFNQEPVAVKELLTKAAEPFQIPMELKNQTFDMDIQENMIVTGDNIWLMESFSNLFKNCVEHTPEGGRIAVSGGWNNLYAWVEIIDNGPGFSDGDIPYLFDRFYKGRNASWDSVGIGLALSKSIINHHNGTITAGNRPEGGAVFTVKFYANTAV